MPELTKEIKRLYFVEKLSYRQVAEELKVAHSTVSTRLKLLGGGRSPKESTLLRSSPEYSEKIRQTKLGYRNHQAKLTEQEVIAIRSEYEKLQGTFNKTQSQYLLADEYGVSRSAISDIVRRQTWRHI